MRNIQIQPLPNQELTFTLGKVNYFIVLRYISESLSTIDITANNEVVLQAFRVIQGGLLIPYEYLEKGGNFIFYSQSGSNPDYLEFNVSQFLYYLTPSEVEEVRNAAP